MTRFLSFPYKSGIVVKGVQYMADPRQTTAHNDEWYTPPQYIDSARKVLGSIDTDPASNDLAQSVVQATTYCTIDNPSLDCEWHGTVWLNPPYSRGKLKPFTDKFIQEYEAGNISQGIVLTQSYTDTKWFHELMEWRTAVCFTKGRIKFYGREGTKHRTQHSPIAGSVFMYFGEDTATFHQEFNQYGLII